MGSTEGLAEWVRRAASGETSAFSELYRRTRPLVARLVTGFAPLDSDEVDDVIQESFVRAFRALPRLKEPGAFEAWLLSIARNRARTRLERKAHLRRLEDDIADPEPEAVPPMPESLQLERDIEVVRQLIAELPEGEEKRTVHLFYIEGELSAREIAEQLGVGKSAVTMRLERFRGRIKRELLRRVLAGRWE
ncbi:sigma-70 family RNA polymerase sigma factor [Myxococcus sp. K38C18041901]|uniref:RNA polymerase sigma factor n=1 Tax=Myxococcus guangdongensis TaxID=2906760 RepID=UPI0020A702D6|nr:sigma-70 family RNA polymerase sigma factor [Myxococcus guangdongensis]MCP3057396.1 sigma-70 family RNA polymerase sigma factor [Myxococcus guangdongensis]